MLVGKFEKLKSKKGTFWSFVNFILVNLKHGATIFLHTSHQLKDTTKRVIMYIKPTVISLSVVTFCLRAAFQDENWQYFDNLYFLPSNLHDSSCIPSLSGGWWVHTHTAGQETKTICHTHVEQMLAKGWWWWNHFDCYITHFRCLAVQASVDPHATGLWDFSMSEADRRPTQEICTVSVCKSQMTEQWVPLAFMSSEGIGEKVQ